MCAVPCSKSTLPSCLGFRSWRRTQSRDLKRPSKRRGSAKSPRSRNHCATSGRNKCRQPKSATGSEAAPSYTPDIKSGSQSELLPQPAQTLSAVKAKLLNVEEKQVDVEVLASDIEVDLSADEREAGS